MDKKDRREKVQIKVMKGNRARKSQNTSHTHTHTHIHTHAHTQSKTKREFCEDRKATLPPSKS